MFLLYSEMYTCINANSCRDALQWKQLILRTISLLFHHRRQDRRKLLHKRYVCKPMYAQLLLLTEWAQGAGSGVSRGKARAGKAQVSVSF